MEIKSKWQSEIEKDKIERVKSINYALNTNIEKSIVSDITYSDTDLKYISKNGSEIRSKLDEERFRLGLVLAEIKLRKTKLIKEIGFEPEKNNYSFEGEEKQPNTYGYEKIKESEELSEKMREYNRCVDKSIYMGREFKVLKTILDGIKDKKDYKLNINIASKLGF